MILRFLKSRPRSAFDRDSSETTMISDGAATGFEPVFESRPRFRQDSSHVTSCLVPRKSTRLKHAASSAADRGPCETCNSGVAASRVSSPPRLRQDRPCRAMPALGLNSADGWWPGVLVGRRSSLRKAGKLSAGALAATTNEPFSGFSSVQLCRGSSRVSLSEQGPIAG